MRQVQPLVEAQVHLSAPPVRASARLLSGAWVGSAETPTLGVGFIRLPNKIRAHGAQRMSSAGTPPRRSLVALSQESITPDDAIDAGLGGCPLSSLYGFFFSCEPELA